jgi:elongation factor G
MKSKASDIAAGVGYLNIHAGDTRRAPTVNPGRIGFPEPVTTPSTKTQADVRQNGHGDHQAHRGRPTLKVNTDETGQTVLRGMWASCTLKSSSTACVVVKVEINQGAPMVAWGDSYQRKSRPPRSLQRPVAAVEIPATSCLKLGRKRLTEKPGFEVDNAIVGGVIPPIHCPIKGKKSHEAKIRWRHFPIEGMKVRLHGSF